MSATPQTAAEPCDGLLLPGLDGANPLGFLAALGLFRILNDPGAPGALRMAWMPSGGTWVPVLHASAGFTLEQDEVLDTLTARLADTIEHHPASLLSRLDSASENEDRRRVILQEIADGTDRLWMDWASALASDFASPESINQLQTTRRDYFFGNLKSVISRTTRDHLHRAIFRPWDYADALDNQSLHWDPSEDRRHAHQWNKPAGDPDRKSHGGMLGANRLALEAIAFFPSFPEGNSLHTVGFTGNRSTNTRWTWPIWRARLSMPIMGSLLGLAILQNQKESLDLPDVAALKAQGIAAVFRTRRILVGKTPNFTPAQCIA
jgi:CRISPR-associated endonuclease/helicase Cas3